MSTLLQDHLINMGCEVQPTRSQTSTRNQPARVPRSRDWQDYMRSPQPLRTATGPMVVS